MHLVDPERLTAEEINMLRLLVNELDEQAARKKRR
jgi:hypothetical protein